MKRIISITALFFLCTSLFAQGVVFKELTLNQALTDAKSNPNSPKIVFIDCYASWWGPCKNMKENVFPLQICGDFFNSNFINLSFDMEKGEGKDIATKYQINVYPTFLILDADGNEVNRVVGGSGAETFIESVKEAMNPANSPLAKKAAYEQNKNSATLLAYVESLEKAYKKNEASDVIKSVFFTLSPRERYASAVWNILSSPGQDFCNADSELFGHLLLHKYEADNALGKTVVDEHLMKIFKVFLMAHISGYKTYPQHIIERNVVCANALANNDHGLQYMLKMLQKKNEGNMDELVNMLKYNVVRSYDFSLLDKEMIEKAITGIKDLTPDQKNVVVQYYKDKNEALTREANYAKSSLDRLLR